MSHYAFGRIDVVVRLASMAPGLVNAMNNAPGVSTALKSALHIHEKRRFPRFDRAFTRTVRPKSGPVDDDTPAVFLWADTFNNYFRPSAMCAAYRVLTDAGFRITLPSRHLCCGRPLYDFGMLDTAKRYLLRTLDALTPQLEAGTPIVVLEPSCASVFRDELTNLLPLDSRARKLRDQTLLLSEFLIRHAPRYRPPRIAQRIIVHGHCHHHAVMGMKDELTILCSTGAEVKLLDSGCCGMAGPFGFEDDKYEISQILGERVLLPSVRRESPDAIIVADGFSCFEQITQNTTARPKHFAEVLVTDCNPEP